MDPNGLQEVRKIIESSTSKVSLRDLEKKGFRKVKVLRSNDIDEMIRRAVTAVVAREQTDGGRISEELIQRSKEELKKLMSQTQQIDQERTELISQNEALEASLRDANARLEEARRLQESVKELQRRLADEQESRARDLQRKDAEAAEMRRRVDDLQARAQAGQAAAAGADEAREKTARVRDELEETRSKLKQLETEKRLLEQLELPKLRERVGELEGELRAARSRPEPAAGASEDSLRAMFREMLKEAGAGGGGGADAKVMQAEFAKLQNAIAGQLAQAGGRGEKVTDADLDAAKVSIAALFKHDQMGTGVVSNMNEVKFKEQTTTSDLKGKLDKLKSLRKGGKSE